MTGYKLIRGINAVLWESSVSLHPPSSLSLTGCRSQLFCWKPGDPSGWARDHRWANHVLLYLPGWDMAHTPPGNLWAACQAQPYTQHQYGAPCRDGEEATWEEAIYSQTGRDTMSNILTVSQTQRSIFTPEEPHPHSLWASSTITVWSNFKQFHLFQT